MALSDFKNFVKTIPSLSSYVNSGKMTWQKFYDMYSLYGNDSSIWNKYKEEYIEDKNNLSIKEMVNNLKNIDMKEIQSGIESIRKGITLLQDLFSKKSDDVNTSYEPRPLHKYFDD